MSQVKSPLWDKNFLSTLDVQRDREVYARVTALTFDEYPIERIEGLVTGGSINIDGSSAIRRTCSLQMVAKDLDINNYYWGLKSKFRLEIGLKNTIKNLFQDETNKVKWGDLYSDNIIWYPQGIYVITSFNTTQNTQNYTVNVTGKDKMCFLNGNMGGNLPASIDFGTEEYYDAETQETTYTQIPIERIIREGVHTYAKEPYHNIVINDLDAAAVELLEYRGDAPLYLLREVDGTNANLDQFTNYTLNGDMKVQFYDKNLNQLNTVCRLSEIAAKGGCYDPRVELDGSTDGKNSTIVKFLNEDEKPTGKYYSIAKVEYGQTAGYRYTDLTYAGDLISSIGEAFTSILDKIKAMLGEFEYFYDLDGRFVFQKKKTYTQTSWNNIVKIGDQEYVESAAHTSSSVYKFEDSILITSFQNNPNLSNLKNDYSIWGQRDGTLKAKIPIHYRYAIDIKPTIYKQITISSNNNDLIGFNAKHPDTPLTPREAVDCVIFVSNDYQGDLVVDGEKVKQYDWRELIYQMALDYFTYNQLDCYTSALIQANPETCFSGTTGYEQYYTDLQGFWRQLYNPEPEADFVDYDTSAVEESFKALDEKGQDTDLRIRRKYTEIKMSDDTDFSSIGYNNIWALIDVEYEKGKNRYELHPWIDAIKLEGYLQDPSPIEYYRTGPMDEEGNIKYVLMEELNTRKNCLKTDVYILEDGQYHNPYKCKNRFADILGLYTFEDNDEQYYLISELDMPLQKLYIDNNKYFRYLYQSRLELDGSGVIENTLPIQYNIKYFGEYYNYIIDKNEDNMYWNKMINDNPSSLNFWFDFLDANSELGEFSTIAVGDRTKVVNDNKVTSIYFRQVPNLIFSTKEDWAKREQKDEGYTVVFMTGNMANMFSISSQGKSAQDKLDELIYDYSYCIESVTIQAVPVYYLQPNTRIFVRDDMSKINGEYIISKISLPLAYSGTMSITATKAPTRIN